MTGIYWLVLAMGMFLYKTNLSANSPSSAPVKFSIVGVHFVVSFCVKRSQFLFDILWIYMYNLSHYMDMIQLLYVSSSYIECCWW